MRTDVGHEIGRLLGTVEEVMQRRVVVLRTDQSVGEAARDLERGSVSGAPVRDGERIVGMVNLSDLFRSAGVSPADAATSGPWHRYEHMMSTSKVGRTVADAMTTDVVMLPPDALIAEAAAVMRHREVNRIPVVDADGVLLGIVARDDVIAAVAEAARPRGQPQPRPGATRIPPD